MMDFDDAESGNSTGSSLKKVINVTGTIIHTNLGRSMLSSEAIRSVERACSSYVNLEYDIESGQRGHRDSNRGTYKKAGRL